MAIDNSLSFTEVFVNGITIIKAEGCIDSFNSHILEKKFKENVGKSNYKLIINMKGLSFVGSAGWGILLSYLKKLSEKGGGLKIVAMNGDVDSVYRNMEFFEVLESYKDESEALASFRAH